MTIAVIHRKIRQMASSERARICRSFFKTGPGEYGAGDQFIGLTVPQVRQLALQFRQLSLHETQQLLRSPIHEERLLALLILVGAFAAGDSAVQERIYKIYLRSTLSINNWDLVDTSAPQIVGAFLATRSQLPLRRLARSPSLWERRIAILATFYFIRLNNYAPTLTIARKLLFDQEDLIHKAVGWMLREVGKRDPAVLVGFLQLHYRQMPQTMLRYAIERFPERSRQRYLRGLI